MEGLATQILERKALDRVLEYATYEDVPYEEEEDAGQVEALDQAAAGEEQEEDEPTPAAEQSSETQDD